LDTREHVLRGGNSGPVVVPGDPDHSLLTKATNQTDSRIEMPPPGKLTSEEISILETWVKEGVVWGEPSESSAAIASHEYVITPEQRAFWSFQPLHKPLQPNVERRSWVKSPIDTFILAKLEAHGKLTE
jgi:Planctomycete cytochrome C